MLVPLVVLCCVGWAHDAIANSSNLYESEKTYKYLDKYSTFVILGHLSEVIMINAKQVDPKPSGASQS